MAAEKPDAKPNDATRTVQTTPDRTDTPQSTPRLPHERDESGDSQVQEESRVKIERAYDDRVAGRQDTDRGTPANEAYQKQKTPPAGP